jgi:hypothetical protein
LFDFYFVQGHAPFPSQAQLAADCRLVFYVSHPSYIFIGTRGVCAALPNVSDIACV